MTDRELRELADRLENLADHLRAMEPDVSAYRDSDNVGTVADFLRQCAERKPVGTLRVSMFRGHLENRDFDYTGDLPEGVYMLYAAPAPQPLSDSRCPYLMHAGSVCNKCGRVHDGGRPEPAPQPMSAEQRKPNPDEVICPACTHQFRAIPKNVQDELDWLRAGLNGLVMLVGRKYPGESRYETAARYIRQAESSCGGEACEARGKK